MAEGGYKHMKISYGSRKIVIPYKSQDEFIDKCKKKFEIGQNEDVTFMLPDDDAELDPDCLNDFPNNQTLQMSISARESGKASVGQDYRVSKVIAQADRLSLHQVSDPKHLVSDDIDQSNTGLDCYDESMYETGSDECIDESLDEELSIWGDASALRKHFEQCDTTNIAQDLEDSLDGWKKQPVNIAVTGQSGKGKSSLINAFLGLSEVDVKAAPVGEKETTSNCYPYNHPRYKNIVFWDIPGCGTQNFPPHSYMENINASQYDFFLIVSSERFHELDIWLAQEILKRKSLGNCYFVRSKVDIDMDNREKRHKLKKGISTNKQLFEEFKLEVKSDIIKALGKDSHIQLFLLSSRCPDEYDFESLQLKILEDASLSKRISLTFGMNVITKNMLEYKGTVLRSRQLQVARLSAFSKHASEKLVFPCDIDHIKSELLFYQQQLSLDKRGLAFAASLTGERPEVVGKHVKFKTVPLASTDKLIQSLNHKHKSLTKLEQFCPETDIHALATIESFLQQQLQKAINDSEGLIKFIMTD